MGVSARVDCWPCARFASAPIRASASTVLYRTDAQLIAMSERVVHGRVMSQRTTKAGPDGETIYTVTTLQIIEDLTGVSGATIEIWELGGVLGDEFLYVGGAVEYRVGEDVLVCLERGPYGFRSVSMGFSKFDVILEANGERALRRNMRDTVVIGGGAAAAAVTRDRTLSEFRALALSVTGRQSQKASRHRGAPRSIRSRNLSHCSAAPLDSGGLKPIPERRSGGTRTPPHRLRSIPVMPSVKSRPLWLPGPRPRLRRSSSPTRARPPRAPRRVRGAAFPRTAASSPSRIRTTR